MDSVICGVSRLSSRKNITQRKNKVRSISKKFCFEN